MSENLGSSTIDCQTISQSIPESTSLSNSRETNLKPTEDLCDLNVPYDTPNLAKIIEELVEYGFYFIAISKTFNVSKFSFDKNTKVDDQVSDQDGKKSKLERQKMRENILAALEPPRNLSTLLTPSALARATRLGKRVRLFTRITLQCEGCSEANLKLFLRDYQSHLAAFDLISLTPSSSEQFNLACQLPSVDVISLDLLKVSQGDLYIPHKALRQAWRTRNVFLEVTLASLFYSPPPVKSAVVFLFTEMKNGRTEGSLVISSGAISKWDIRSPVAIVCVARAFGMSPQLAARTIKENPQKVLEHALVRKRTIQGAVAIMKLQRKGGVVNVEVVPPNEPQKTGDVPALSDSTDANTLTSSQSVEQEPAADKPSLKAVKRDFYTANKDNQTSDVDTPPKKKKKKKKTKTKN